MEFKYNDGGRAVAGFKGKARDCVTRSVAIATCLPYAQVHADFDRLSKSQRGRKGGADKGIHTNRKWFKDYMKSFGWTWTPCMTVGSGCKVHVRADELPPGRLILSLSRHVTAVLDGVIHDTHDPSRNGTRCVYGYWRKA